MKKTLKRLDLFLILAIIFSYVLGLILAKSQGKTVPFIYIVSGLFFMLGIYLAETFAIPESPFLEKEGKLTVRAKTFNEPRLLLLLGSIALTFLSLFFLIKAHFFEYLFLPALFVLLGSAAISLNNSVRSNTLPLRWCLDAFAISPIAYFFGLQITGLKLAFYPYMLSIPLFLIAAASAMALFFARFQDEPFYQQAQSMRSFNWDKALLLFDALSLLGYGLLSVYLLSSGAFGIGWPALLFSLPSLLLSVLLHRILQGMQPNWKLLKTIATINYLGPVYLLAYAFLTH
ncbi:MAG: hypothetical protein VB108_04055 [Anaerolineaceae bacterium]|nr:hypothetical protein [Anaerolineaceae bacterium]